MIDGTVVNLRGEDFTIPPLTLGALRKLTKAKTFEALAAVGAAMTDEQAGAMLEVILAAMKPNYPDLTADRLEELLDTGNIAAVFRAVIAMSGLKGGGETSAGGPTP